jgi:TonB-linked SusC/RagA family outer membrane protein
MVRKIVLSIIAVLAVSFAAIAQNVQVSGTVADESGAPVIGAAVVVDGTSIGTVTGVDGSFKLSAPANGTITVSFVGYEEVKTPIAGKTSINVVLKTSAERLDDVVVVAFGSKRKQDVVGSVSSVKSTIINNSQATSVSSALEGAVAGLQVISSTGQPGADSSIVLRGIGSLSGGNTALIVVDGVPFNGRLSDINPADIQSITVSKDAVSNSLYGSRAANGVVMVTTKSGRQDRTQINFTANWGVTNRAYKDYDYVTDQGEFYELTWYGIRNTNMLAGMSAEEAALAASQSVLGELGNYNSFIIPDGEFLVGTDGKLNKSAKERYNDSFADALFDSAMRQEYQVSASGGTDKTNYYLSMGYLDNDSYVIGSDYNRISARANVNSQLKSWLKVGTNIAYSVTEMNGVKDGVGQASNPFDVARSWAPIFPVHGYDEKGNLVYDANGEPVYDAGTGQTAGTLSRPIATNQNVICSMLEDINRNKYHNLTTRSFIEIKFLKDFTFTTNYSYDYTNNNATTFYSTKVGDGQSFGGRGTRGSYNSYTQNFNQLLAYNKVVGDHNISAKIGHEYYNYKSDSFSGQKTRFFDPLNPELDNGGQLEYISSSTSEHSIEGYFGMADYNYANKYYVSGAFRRDGTSRFLNRWGNFWSVGLAWRISGEEWMKNAEWINDLKLRASYGTQGNESVLNATPYMDQYSITWDGSQLGYSPSFYGNPDLTWEKQKTIDAGVDFRFWDRVYGSVEYFYRRTDDMLFQKTLAPTAGRPYNWENLGAMSNQGIEFEVNVDILKGRDFSWTATLVGSHYTNKILTLPEENREDGIVSGTFKLFEGKNRYEYFTYQYAGLDENGGAQWWMDEVDQATGEKTGKKVKTSTYSDATKEWLGKTALPDLTGGFNTTFQWKGIDLTIATAFQLGGWAYDSEYTSGLSNSFYVGHHKDLWKTYNPVTGEGEYPVWNANNSSNSYGQTSDAHLIKASYFSIRNITLGYSFPKAWMNKLGIGGIRVYVTGDNVALFSKRQGFDPRVSMSGGNGSFGGYSPMRVVSGGINLTF